MQEVKVIFEDEYLLVADKPHGLVVHPSPMARNATGSLLEEVQELIGKKAYPIHRLDRPASGLVLFAKSSSVARELNVSFREREVYKKYLAITRGFAGSGQVNRPLNDENKGNRQPSFTTYKEIFRTEQPFAIGPYQNSRYSLIEAFPHTGRFHQIRRHMAHIGHPIIGDVKHGDRHHNRYFREILNINFLLLRGIELQFTHPITKNSLRIYADLNEVFKRTIHMLNLS